MITGIIISLITFPGVIIHELAHQVFCHLFGVRVHEVVYFQVKDLSAPAGYVLHDPPQNFCQTVWISIGPLILNTTLTIIIGLLASKVTHEGACAPFLVWLGMSIGLHAFPSDPDMSHIGHEAEKHSLTVAQFSSSYRSPSLFLYGWRTSCGSSGLMQSMRSCCYPSLVRLMT